MEQYNMKMIECGNRLEAYHYNVPILCERINNQDGRKGKYEQEKRNIEKNRRETLNKARNKIIRLVNCNPDMQAFVTLTYSNNMQNLKKSKGQLGRCIRLLNQTFPRL